LETVADRETASNKKPSFCWHRQNDITALVLLKIIIIFASEPGAIATK
jgi:hypothetical protein